MERTYVVMSDVFNASQCNINIHDTSSHEVGSPANVALSPHDGTVTDHQDQGQG